MYTHTGRGDDPTLCCTLVFALSTPSTLISFEICGDACWWWSVVSELTLNSLLLCAHYLILSYPVFLLGLVMV